MLVYFGAGAKPNDCFVHLFKGGAPRAVALAAQANPPFLFCKAFFFVAIPPKKKADKGF